MNNAESLQNLLKDLATFAPQDFKVCLSIFQIRHESVENGIVNTIYGGSTMKAMLVDCRITVPKLLAILAKKFHHRCLITKERVRLVID